LKCLILNDGLPFSFASATHAASTAFGSPAK
jgi:hypothetical protein